VEVFEIAVGGSTALPTRFGSTSPHDFTVVSVHVFSLRPTCSFVEPADGSRLPVERATESSSSVLIRPCHGRTRPNLRRRGR